MPRNFNFPGVYIKEVPSHAHSIQGVATSTTAFIGTSAAGDFNQPVEIHSFAEFERTFGGLDHSRELGFAVRQYFLNGGKVAWVVRVPDTATDAEWVGGIQALDSVDLFNLLVLPGMSISAIVREAVAYCERRRAFLILDSPEDAKMPTQVRERVESGAFPQSANVAVYYPWVLIADPLGGAVPKLTPPGGSIAGLYSRTDSTRGVWKAPAGTEANLIGVQGLDYVLKDTENAPLNSQGINALRTFATHGPVVWGARTLAGADRLGSEWKYIPVRRLALFVEESLYRGLKWVVFEPNDEPLWAKLRLNIGAFMHNLFRQGAFQGPTPREAYFVKCDLETTTQSDIDIGVVNILVGFAPLKRAEFVLIKLQQRAGQAA